MVVRFTLQGSKVTSGTVWSFTQQQTRKGKISLKNNDWLHNRGVWGYVVQCNMIHYNIIGGGKEIEGEPSIPPCSALFSSTAPQTFFFSGDPNELASDAA